MSFILPQSAADRSLFYRDRDYYSSMVSLPDTPIQLALMEDDIVAEVFSSFIVEAFSTDDEDAVEYTMTGEGSKIRVGDRLIRNITLSGIVLDSAAEGQTGQTTWRKFYERGRLSQIAASGRRVRITLPDMVCYGGFIRTEPSLMSDDPNKVSISVTLMCLRVELPSTSSVTNKVAGTDFYGKVSYEGLVNIGLIGPLAVNPISVRFPGGGAPIDAGDIKSIVQLQLDPKPDTASPKPPGIAFRIP